MTDVVIAGAGPAGSLAALILAKAGVRVRVFERARFPREKLCGDTLNPGALRVLARHLPVASIVRHGVPISGMRLSGPGGVSVEGRYGAGVTGRALARRDLDLALLDAAVVAGAEVEELVTVVSPVLDAPTSTVCGVVIRSGRGAAHPHSARLVIAADGRASSLARALRLSSFARCPRRWAVGGYCEGVQGLADLGEMHVRHGHYIGVAPMPDGLANTCLVLDGPSACGSLREPAGRLMSALRADATLAPRVARARLVTRPIVLGPMAVTARTSGVPGLLAAGDAAGFVDPMTGDGLHFALLGAEIAANVALEHLQGRLNRTAAVAVLETRRRAAFGAKWRFNRVLRALVGATTGVSIGTAAARVWPDAFRHIIRYAGDC
jgi:flavin-dependent dehydrogenase